MYRTKIEKTVKAAIENKETAGTNILILHKGNEVYYHEDGWADMEQKKPVQRDSIFRLYSMTKPVTAVAVMVLLERGEIDLFEPVSRYLPGFKKQKVIQNGDFESPIREITIRDLLNMTSGLLYPDENPAGRKTAEVFEELDRRLFSGSPMTTMELADKLGKVPLAFHPGEKWAYGTSADILGALVEQVSGQRFGEFLSKEIFEPLGMKDTAFYVPDEKQHRLACVYESLEGKPMARYTGNHLGIIHDQDKSPAFESGGAGLFSTIDDYALFANMLMNGGRLDNERILKEQTVNFLTTQGLEETQMVSFRNWNTLAGFTYGNLMRVMVRPDLAGGLVRKGEYGWDGWLGCYFANFPAEELTILLMMQKKDAGTIPLTRKLRNIILSNLDL